jgi:hypothetical protein
MPIAIGFMLFALIIGILRLMEFSDIYPYNPFIGKLYPLHAPVMIIGFIALLIIFERLMGLGISIPIKPGKYWLAIPILILGVMGYIYGVITSNNSIIVASGVMMSIAVIIFILLLIRLRALGLEDISLAFMILSSFSLLTSIALTTFYTPKSYIGSAVLLLSFPVLFILGERYELSKLILGLTKRRILKISFYIMLLSLSLLVAYTFYYIDKLLIIMGSLGYFSSVLIFYLAERPNIKNLRRSEAKLQNYLAVHLQAAYHWLLGGIALLLLYSVLKPTPYLYDAAIHSISVGFIGTMLIGHGPLILSSLMGKIVRQEKLNFVPFYLLTLGNGIRVFGDLIKPIYIEISILIGYSGILILLAFIAFIINIRRL